MQSHSGSTSPSHTRGSIPKLAPQTVLDAQNPYSQTRPAIGQGTSFNRSQPKSNLDPLSGSFNFVRKQSGPSYGYNDDKENSAQYLSNGDSYEIDIPSRYRAVGNNASRDSSIPPPRASDAGLNGSSMQFGNPGAQFGSIGHHTPSSSVHSQRPSISGASAFPSQMNGSRYEVTQNETELSEKFASLGLNREEQSNASQINNNFTSYSPNNTSFAQQNYPLNGASGMWGNEVKGLNNFEAYSNQPFADQGYFNNKPSSRFTERSSVSPAGSDYRQGLRSPKYYSANGTPPSGPEQAYRPVSRGARIPQGPSELAARMQAIHLNQQAQYIYASQFQTQYTPQGYEYQAPVFRQGAVPYGYVAIPAYPPAQVIPTRPAKDQDVGVGVRSVLLEEFRSNGKGNKRYELKDIYNHVVEFSGDQHGSRFIQQKLETANSDEKEQIFREIQPNALQLMTDVFGNYVIQKLFEHGNQVQKRMIAEHMKNHVMELSMQMYGCRVVQKALEHVLADQQAQLVEELRADVMKCIKDQNGNHVVQKAIERVPTEHLQFVIEAFRGQVHILATHPYGCRVIQRILEYCKPRDQASILEELHMCSTNLITDQYGNYVTQHVIQHGKPEDRAKVIKIVTAQLLTLSKHKFASNVVEKSIQYGTDEQRRLIVAQLTALHSDGSSPLQLLMKDQFGNYVIQKLLGQLKGAEREAFVEDIKPQLLQLKKYNFGKQIAAIEKLIFTGPQPSYGMTPSSVAPNAQSMPIEINSSAPTPSLTNGQNSPQSSSLPSTSVSTIDEPVDIGKMIEINGKPCPEVTINGI